MGTETYTKEYPTDIRATWDSPTKTYEPAPAVSSVGDDNASVSIGLQGTVTSSQPQEQHYEKVTLEKRKRLAFGLFPSGAEQLFRPKKAMVPQTGQLYKGNGEYGTYSTYEGHNMPGLGACVGFYLLFGTVESLLWEPFAPYEQDVHYFGRYLKSTRYGNTVNNTFAAEDVERLLKFSPAERQKIGAWTYHENATHPHNTFWNGFRGSGIVGFNKHCYYVFRDPEKLSRTTPVAPKVTTARRTVSGPYTVTLRLPALGYLETVAVEAGAKDARFDLSRVANGDVTADGYVRYALPAEGIEALRNADDRSLLERATTQEWPVRVALPAPSQSAVASSSSGTGVTSPAPVAGPLYSIESIEQREAGGYVVRLGINDTSKTLEIMRSVQPEVSRLVREDFSSRNPGVSADSIHEVLQPKTERDGKALVFTGWAFSVRPLEDGWSYDPDTRRGWIRLRILGGMPAEDAKRWARNNIASIVAEKGVAAEAGKAPAYGATYRSLGEQYENGVLTVEFEAEP